MGGNALSFFCLHSERKTGRTCPQMAFLFSSPRDQHSPKHEGTFVESHTPPDGISAFHLAGEEKDPRWCLFGLSPSPLPTCPKFLSSSSVILPIRQLWRRRQSREWRRERNGGGTCIFDELGGGGSIHSPLSPPGSGF